MRSLKSIFIWMVVLGISVSLTHAALANEKCHKDKGYHESKIKLLKEASTALAKSNPELAQKLSNYANEETKETREMKDKHETKAKLLKDSAAALEKSNPDLAKKLEEMSQGNHKKCAQEIQEKNEKEEPGETTEPKGDK